MGERCPGTPRTARRGHGAPGTAGATGRGPRGSAGAGRGRGGLRVAALSLALLFLRAEAEGFALCHAPALQTEVFQYRLWDVNQRSLYLRGDQLVAGHLQGANAALEGDAGTRAGTRAGTAAGTRAEGPRVTHPPAEKVFWVPNRALEPARLPVILGIRSGSRCLRTERGPAGEPRLRLQDVDIRELPRAGDSAAAFTFFRSYRDGLWRFESAAHPGWFLCTSPRGHQPLALCRHRDVTSNLLDFYFQLC
ncbi:interleukin-1 family member 10-like isoform 1-T1 [Ammospiza maritima maritima]